MRLYVNGDSHAAAAEAAVPHAFAEDDSRYQYLGRRPHPENFRVSWAHLLSQALEADLEIDAESASSNDRIQRTTRERLASGPRPDVVIIQWSTWERQEWLIQGQHFQITASGTDDVPPDHRIRYQQYIADLDWGQCRDHWHREIWQLHLDLQDLAIDHVFFNGNSHFGDIPPDQRWSWGASYVNPYDPKSTYDQWLRRQGHSPVSSGSWHFGPDAHRSWADFMLQYINDNGMGSSS